MTVPYLHDSDHYGNKIVNATLENIFIKSNSWIYPLLSNGWVNFGAPYSTAAYRKLSDGTIEFKGTIKKAASATPGEKLFNLPAGFRPIEYRIYSTLSNNGIGRIDVQSNGDVVFGAGSNLWISLDNIRFVAES